MARINGRLRILGPGILALVALAGCDQQGRFDLDMRDNFAPSNLDTSDAAQRMVADRPRPDDRGVISYPGYQVAVARRGDTLADVAGRVGLSSAELSEFNGVPPNVPLRQGEVIALPRRVAEPSPATGADATGPIRPGGTSGGLQTERVDVSTLAGDAIQRSQGTSGTAAGTGQTRTAALPPAQPAAPASQPRSSQGAEPVRHRVARGETAFSIARQYRVPPEALREWNGLGSDLAVREGQYLMIPPVTEVPRTTPAAQPLPGQGSTAPVPPSAAKPLPAENATPAPPKDTPKKETLGEQATAASDTARLALPVTGPIIRGFRKGKNDGIDIQASPGTAVRAADAGTVATITRDTGQVPILVLRHADNLLTVYAGVEAVNVEKGDKVKRGQTIAKVAEANPSFVHFEVLEGFESVDPAPYLE